MKVQSLSAVSFTILTLGSIAPSAQAQSERLQGFSVALGLNRGSASVDSSGSGGVTAPLNGSSAISLSAALQAQYSRAITPRSAISVGLSDVLPGYRVATLGVNKTNVAIKNIRSLYFAPGFFLNNDIYLYAKAGAVLGNTTLGSGTTLSGNSIGAGVTYLAGKNIFVQSEFLMFTFGDANHIYQGLQYTDQYKINSVSAAIGYAF